VVRYEAWSAGRQCFAETAASSSLLMEVGPEGEVKYSWLVYSLNFRESTRGIKLFVIELVELGLIMRILFVLGVEEAMVRN